MQCSTEVSTLRLLHQENRPASEVKYPFCFPQFPMLLIRKSTTQHNKQPSEQTYYQHSTNTDQTSQSQEPRWPHPRPSYNKQIPQLLTQESRDQDLACLATRTPSTIRNRPPTSVPPTQLARSPRHELRPPELPPKTPAWVQSCSTISTMWEGISNKNLRHPISGDGNIRVRVSQSERECAKGRYRK